MAITDFLALDTITVQTPTTTQDAAAGRVYSAWNDTFVDVPARVEDPTAQQRIQYAQLDMAVQHRIFTAQSGISNGDRILSSDGRYFRVTGVSHRRAIGTIPDFYVVMAEEIQPAI